MEVTPSLDFEKNKIKMFIVCRDKTRDIQERGVYILNVTCQYAGKYIIIMSLPGMVESVYTNDPMSGRRMGSVFVEETFNW